MKSLVALIGMMVCACLVQAQTTIDQTWPVKAGQTIKLHFDHPRVVRISTWDRSEISVKGSVLINGGENNDAFTLLGSTDGNVVSVRNKLKIDDLPSRITIIRDGQRTTFRSKSEWKKYKTENGGRYDVMSEGPDIEIVLDIKVPTNTMTTVESIYGMVEVIDFNGPIEVTATYGGVDATLHGSRLGDLKAETYYGQIFSNLDLPKSAVEIKEGNFHLELIAHAGKGPACTLESKYGNVYLRKPTP